MIKIKNIYDNKGNIKYIPAKRKSDNAVGFFDVVNKKFHPFPYTEYIVQDDISEVNK